MKKTAVIGSSVAMMVIGGITMSANLYVGGILMMFGIVAITLWA